MPDYYLFVPQGCYIEISPKTSKECIGLITHSMATCYPVVVAVKGHIFLSHVDAETDISDELYGVPNWVKRINDEGADKEIKIYLFSGDSDAENSY